MEERRACYRVSPGAQAAAMAPIEAIFIDDGDVMNDNARRGPQWQRLVGEYLAPRLGGDQVAWGRANQVIAEKEYAKLGECPSRLLPHEYT